MDVDSPSTTLGVNQLVLQSPLIQRVSVLVVEALAYAMFVIVEVAVPFKMESTLAFTSLID